MMGRRPFWGALHQRPDLQLVLSIVGGVATAAVGVLYLPSAWSDVKSCTHPPAGCGARPFWGFAPSLFLLACLVGVVAGAMMVAVGFLAVRAAPRAGWAGYLVIGLSGAGLLAYGGFGVGVVAGVLAGLLISEPHGSDSPSPEEWSGSLPVGVPPVPRGAKRPPPGRPSLTEWDGIVAASRLSPTGAGRGPVTLPTADRLAKALERSRLSPAAAASSVRGPSPVVFLPPPPVGLRASPGAVRAVSPTTPPPRPVVSRGPERTVPESRRLPAPASASRWAPEPADLGPAVAAPVAPGPASAPLSPPRPTAPQRTLPSSDFRLSRGPQSRAHYVPGTASRGPLRTPRGSDPPPPPTFDPEPEEPSDRPDPPAADEAAGTPPFIPGPPSPESPRATAATAPSGPAGPRADRPAPPTGAAAKPRTRAWRCPMCKLVNAPWSPKCTRCQAEAPAAS